MSDAKEAETRPKAANLRYRRNRGWEEMPKMCAFPSGSPGGDLIYVNPVNVLYVREGGPGTTMIYCSDKQTLSVNTPIETAIRLLDTAMNVDH